MSAGLVTATLAVGERVRARRTERHDDEDPE
jgi:hypothetical protein